MKRKNRLSFKQRLVKLFWRLVRWRLFKFAVVGSIGAMVQLSSLVLFRRFFTYQLAYFFSVEMAVLSNFVFNNIWTFSDRKLSLKEAPLKFIHFNLASSGSIIIQQITAFVGERFIGLWPVFTLPIVNFTIDTGMLYAVAGILLGMSWNFFAYNAFIWKKKAR